MMADIEGQLPELAEGVERNWSMNGAGLKEDGSAYLEVWGEDTGPDGNNTWDDVIPMPRMVLLDAAETHHELHSMHMDDDITSEIHVDSVNYNADEDSLELKLRSVSEANPASPGIQPADRF